MPKPASERLPLPPGQLDPYDFDQDRGAEMDAEEEAPVDESGPRATRASDFFKELDRQAEEERRRRPKPGA